MFIYYLFIIIINYHIFNILEYFLHKASHDIRFRRLYNWHKYHHTVEFPPCRLIYNNHTGPPIYENVFLQIALCFLAILYFLLSRDIYYIVFSETILLMKVDDYLHTSYHKDNSYLEN